jgi:iron-sulfur cluster assembly accessory protein
MVQVTKQARESSIFIHDLTVPRFVGQDNQEQVADLIMTESCWRHLDKLVRSKNQEHWYLRLFVDAGGCSGFTYQFDFTNTDKYPMAPDDLVWTATVAPDDAPRSLVVDPASYELLQGSTIDYVTEMIKSSFVVSHNPQSESACGCGSSFAIKNFAANTAAD